MNAIPLIAGFLAGAAGAMGLGGGFVLIVYLTWIGLSAPEAAAANLMFFIPTAFVSMLMNRRKGLADLSVLPYAAASGSIGAILGLLLSGAVDGRLLRTAFALMLIAVGMRELLHKSPERKRAEPENSPG